MNIQADPTVFKATLHKARAAQNRCCEAINKSLSAPLCPEDRATMGEIRILLRELDTKLEELKQALSP